MPYKPEDKEAILEKIASRMVGGESVASICKDDGMPDPVTVIRWMNGDDAVANTIARAREMQADTLDDRIQQVIDQIHRGEIDYNAGKAVIWGLQWRAGKLKPKRYGDKVEATLKGDKDNPIATTLQIEFVKSKDKADE